MIKFQEIHIGDEVYFCNPVTWLFLKIRITNVSQLEDEDYVANWEPIQANEETIMRGWSMPNSKMVAYPENLFRTKDDVFEAVDGCKEIMLNGCLKENDFAGYQNISKHFRDLHDEIVKPDGM